MGRAWVHQIRLISPEGEWFSLFSMAGNNAPHNASPRPNQLPSVAALTSVIV